MACLARPPRLCFVTDALRGHGGRPLEPLIAELFAGGVGLVLLRELERSGAELFALCRALAPLRERGLRVVASRRADLAAAGVTDGVQLTADSAEVAEVRAWLGPDALVGYSAHEVAEARQAERAGASWATLSPIYPTASKPGVAGRGTDLLAQAAAELSMPVYALGGITPERVREVRSAGAWGVAAVSALGAAPDPRAAAEAFRKKLEEEPT